VHLDVTRDADWRAAVATAVQAYGKLNVLVNNAGILFRARIETRPRPTGTASWRSTSKACSWHEKAAIPGNAPAGAVDHQHLLRGRAGWKPPEHRGL